MTFVVTDEGFGYHEKIEPQNANDVERSVVIY